MTTDDTNTDDTNTVAAAQSPGLLDTMAHRGGTGFLARRRGVCGGRSVAHAGQYESCGGGIHRR